MGVALTFGCIIPILGGLIYCGVMKFKEYFEEDDEYDYDWIHESGWFPLGKRPLEGDVAGKMTK